MLSLRSSKYILANMYCEYDISMESHFTNLFIDFVFKMTKLRLCKYAMKSKIHIYTIIFLKLKISSIIKDPHLNFLLSILGSS